MTSKVIWMPQKRPNSPPIKRLRRRFSTVTPWRRLPRLVRTSTPGRYALTKTSHSGTALWLRASAPRSATGCRWATQAAAKLAVKPPAAGDAAGFEGPDERGLAPATIESSEDSEKDEEKDSEDDSGEG